MTVCRPKHSLLESLHRFVRTGWSWFLPSTTSTSVWSCLLLCFFRYKKIAIKYRKYFVSLTHICSGSEWHERGTSVTNFIETENYIIISKLSHSYPISSQRALSLKKRVTVTSWDRDTSLGVTDVRKRGNGTNIFTWKCTIEYLFLPDRNENK